MILNTKHSYRYPGCHPFWGCGHLFRQAVPAFSSQDSTHLILFVITHMDLLSIHVLYRIHTTQYFIREYNLKLSLGSFIKVCLKGHYLQSVCCFKEAEFGAFSVWFQIFSWIRCNQHQVTYLKIISFPCNVVIFTGDVTLSTFIKGSFD